MLKFTLVFIVLLTSLNVYAASELVAKTAWKNSNYKIAAELYFDKLNKRADVWIDFEQGTTPEDRVAFKATSIPTRFKEANIKLKQQPATRTDGTTTLIYDGFEVTNNDFNPDRGIAVLFHYPLSDLTKQNAEIFLKYYPNALIKGASGKPEFIKALIIRVTDYNVYPVAAFDIDLGTELKAR
jgi:hypothetical protein